MMLLINSTCRRHIVGCDKDEEEIIFFDKFFERVDSIARSQNIDLLDKDTVNASLTINSLFKTAYFTTTDNTRGGTYIFQSVINDGVDQYGNAKAEYVYNFAIFAIGVNGYRLLAANQTNEGNVEFGWIEDLNVILTEAWMNNDSESLTVTDEIDITGAVTLGGGFQGGYIDGYTLDDTSSADGYGYYMRDLVNGLAPTSGAQLNGTAPALRRYILSVYYYSLTPWNTDNFRPFVVINNSSDPLMICKPTTYGPIVDWIEYITLDAYEAVMLYLITDGEWIAEQLI